MHSLNPKISIITVCYNAEKLIGKTLESIISQDYSNIEYIVIDGKSKDKTMDLVLSYKDRISKIISEPDSGIYEAMNKGIDMASGEWIIFINAGDELLTYKTISDIFRNKTYTSDIIFGDVLNHYEWGYVRVEGRNFQGKESRMPFCHQSVFVRSEILRNHRFDENYKVSADHKQFYQLYQEGYKFEHIDIIVSIFDTTGVSNYSIKGFKEMSKINKYQGLDYLKRMTKIRLKIMLVNILPQFIIDKYRYHKYSRENKIIEFLENR